MMPSLQLDIFYINKPHLFNKEFVKEYILKPLIDLFKQASGFSDSLIKIRQSTIEYNPNIASNLQNAFVF